VFDTETDGTLEQRFNFGVWRLYRDPPDGCEGRTCVEEGIVFAGDLPERDPAGYAAILGHVESHAADTAPGFSRRLVAMSATQWLDERLFLYGYRHGAWCRVVGFHLLFDLGGMASYWSPAEDYYRGGYSLGMWGHFDAAGHWHDRRYRPRILVKSIDPRRALIGWGSLDPDDSPGISPRNFVDLRQLSFALTSRSLTLEGACTLFGDPFEKADVDYSVLDDRLIVYARDDVAHTAALYRRELDELARHEGVELEPGRLYSPATIGTAYLERMGLRRPFTSFTDIEPWALGWTETDDLDQPPNPIDRSIVGWSGSAFFGGRAEARIVRTAVPVRVLDATSMYPLVNALIGSSELLTSEWLEVVDVTITVTATLGRSDVLERCLQPHFWRDELGVTLVELDGLEDQVLPVRAPWDPDSIDPGIGVNPLTYDGRLWYMVQDVIASVLLTGRVPTVRRAFRLVGRGRHDGLQAVRFRGGPTIDPVLADPFLTMINERHRAAASDLPRDERSRLERFFKITANATSYGVLARFDRRELGEAIDLTVLGPDDEPLDRRSTSPEDPGPMAFPPIAAAITASARLMLAVLERLVTDAGGTYAFCDTDSMAILATPAGGLVQCTTEAGETVRALSFGEVARIAARFDALNPFDRGLVSHVWKAEHDSLRRLLWCYPISAKRYVLYRSDERGLPTLIEADGDEGLAEWDRDAAASLELEDWSEHGLGLYVDPIGKRGNRPARTIDGRRTWIVEAWQYILGKALGHEVPYPDWADRPALTQFSVSSPKVGAWFSGRDRSRPFSERVRPGSFGLLAQPTGLRAGRGVLPAAPYDDDPAAWDDLPWYDRGTGEGVSVTTKDPVRDPVGFASALEQVAIPIRTLRDVLDDYAARPEHKSLAPDGGPVGSATRGLLRRRPVHSSPALTRLSGKEGHKLLDRVLGMIDDPAEYRTDYGDRIDVRKAVVLPALRRIGAPALARHVPQRSRRAIERVVYGTTTKPHAATDQAVIAAAVVIASEQLVIAGRQPPDDPLAQLVEYIAFPEPASECACGCRRRARRVWATDACRKRAARASRVPPSGDEPARSPARAG
jgi:hypothetical protein